MSAYDKFSHTVCQIYSYCYLFKVIFGGHEVLFVGPLIPLFWTSGDVCPGFQSQGGSLFGVLSCFRTIIQTLLSYCLRIAVFYIQMTKKIKKLEKETTMWKSRWENSNKALLEMAEDVSTPSVTLGGSTLSNSFLVQCERLRCDSIIFIMRFQLLH